MELEDKMDLFFNVLVSVYNQGDKKDIVDQNHKIDLSEDMTDDFFAMIVAMNQLYTGITGEVTDPLGFTHILNRIVVQEACKKKKEEMQ